MNSDRPRCCTRSPAPRSSTTRCARPRRSAPDRTVVVDRRRRRRGGRGRARPSTPTRRSPTRPSRWAPATPSCRRARRWRDLDGDVIVLYGDTPFVTPETLERMLAARATAPTSWCSASTRPTPSALRPARAPRATARCAIVEWKDADAGDAGDPPLQLGRALRRGDVPASTSSREVGNDNAAGEYYLTDVVALADARGLACAVVALRREPRRSASTRAPSCRRPRPPSRRARAPRRWRTA